MPALTGSSTLFTSIVNPVVEQFNGPTMDESCDRREASIVPTQVFYPITIRMSLNDNTGHSTRTNPFTREISQVLVNALTVHVDFKFPITRQIRSWQQNQGRVTNSK